jgi:TonB family protein
MSLYPAAADEVFSLAEIAQAAGVPATTVRSLVDSGQVEAFDGYVSALNAVRCVRSLRRNLRAPGRRELFMPPPPGPRSARTGAVASGAVHAGLVGLVALLTSLGFSSVRETQPERIDTSKLVFLVKPGVGGGGGGGGLKTPVPVARAEMKGRSSVKSPVPPPRRLTTRTPEPQAKPPEPVAPRPAPAPVEPPAPPQRPAITPQVIAPVVTASADSRDRAGVPSEVPSEAESQGSGSGGGAGSGQGSGVGEGSGAGIGPGSGGGTGGGPYRPGSGITAPELLQEVRPQYTEEARRMGISGDVVLEIIVRHDGTVGDVKVRHGLAGGLDRRAIDAVRQWRFSPARRHGTPVDVIVEVAVEFKLR